MRKSVLFVVILSIIGFLLRFWGEPQHPQGFYQDEAGIAYSAYSVLKTGKDEWNRILPLHFKALGDYPPGIYNYLTALCISFFGLNEMAERFPSILFGTLLIPLSYWLIYTYSKKTNVGLIVSTIITFSPWDIVQSRSGSEPIVALVFSLTAWILFYKWTSTPKKRYLISIGFLYLLAIFTYNSVKFSLPFLHGLLIWYLWPKIVSKRTAAASFVLLLLISIASVFAIPGADKPFQNSFILFKDYSNDSQAYFFREGNMEVPLLLSRLFHNRYALMIQEVFGRFWGYLSGDTLFFQGGFPGRYKIPGVGLILFVLSPFLLVGVVQKKLLPKKNKYLLFMWIFLGLLPGILFLDFYPHVKRIMYALMPLYILIALGLISVFQFFQRLIYKAGFVGIFGGLLIWNFCYAINQYCIHSQYETVISRSYGWGEILKIAKRYEPNYKKVVVYSHNEDPVPFYLFYNQVNPADIQAVAHTRPTNVFLSDSQKREWAFKNYSFNPFPCPNLNDLQSDVLYITIAECINPRSITLPSAELTIHETTFMPDSAPRFILFEKKYISETPQV